LKRLEDDEVIHSLLIEMA